MARGSKADRLVGELAVLTGRTKAEVRFAIGAAVVVTAVTLASRLVTAIADMEYNYS